MINNIVVEKIIVIIQEVVNNNICLWQHLHEDVKKVCLRKKDTDFNVIMGKNIKKGLIILYNIS